MTYDSVERSQDAGAPVEVYRFAVGNAIYRYTSSDAPISLSVAGDGAQTFAPEPISRSTVEYSSEDQAGTLRIGVSRFNAIGQMFMASFPPAPVGVSIYRKHATDSETILLYSGKVSQATYDGANVSLMCLPMTAIFKRNIPRLTYQRECNWALYGPGCTLNKESFKDTVTVGSVSGRDVLAAGFASRADGWYTGGWLENSDGDRRYITGHVGGTVTLQSPFLALAPGASVFAFAGCDRTEATCNAKFSNIDHHLGFQRIPEQNPFDVGMT